jgi:hypothetical protein
MRLHGADRVMERRVWDHEQFRFAKSRDLGPTGLGAIALRSSNLEGDPGFEETVTGITEELED